MVRASTSQLGRRPVGNPSLTIKPRRTDSMIAMRRSPARCLWLARTVAVALCSISLAATLTMWPRSYLCGDRLDFAESSREWCGAIEFSSNDGSLCINTPMPSPWPILVSFHSYRIDKGGRRFAMPWPTYLINAGHFFLILPYWLIALASSIGLIATSSTIRRFSVRSYFLAVASIAVYLAAIRLLSA